MKVSAVDAGREPRQRVDRLRPLQRQQRLLVHMVEHHAARQLRLEMGDVARLGRAVDDEVEMLAAPGHHQIVDDAALVRRAAANICGFESFRIAEVGGEQRLQPRLAPPPGDDRAGPYG